MRIQLEAYGRTAEVETLGGELVSCRDGAGVEYLWQGDPAYWSGRNPLLFPIVGALKDGRIAVNGKEYEMPQHGFARRQEFTVLDHGEGWAELELRENGATLAQYPFPFRLKVRQELTAEGFASAFTVENTGTDPMPFCLGGHTAFNCPLMPGDRFEDYMICFSERETCGALVPAGGLLDRVRTVPFLKESCTLPLKYDYFDTADTLIFEGLKSTVVSLEHRGTRWGVRVRFADFPILALWTKPNARAPYLCIEPWHGCPAEAGEGAEFAQKAHCIILEPGQSRTLGYQVELL